VFMQFRDVACIVFRIRLCACFRGGAVRVRAWLRPACRGGAARGFHGPRPRVCGAVPPDGFRSSGWAKSHEDPDDRDQVD
jgi:hypothetical protein